jgi:glutamate-1-semialdehyde 2,1-aminomutase
MIGRARAHMPNGVPMAWMASEYDQPVYIDHGRGAGFTDLDGFGYVDFNASDMSMFCGHANPAIVAAVQEQAARSTQFLLPTEASVTVAEELARRYPVPQWQFTLSATQANTEAIRLARAVTGREVVVLFEGHYHGHFEEGLVDADGGQVTVTQRGLSKGVTGRVRIAQFNDPGSLREALEPGDVALVLTEPAMTNGIHLLLPEPGWHDALHELTRGHGTLLAIDETHTHVVGPGGATGMWQLRPDIVTIGKAVAGGVPMGAYGVTAGLGEQLDVARNVATGGTLFGNPLSAAAAGAALTEVLVPAAYQHTSALGGELADGIEAAIRSAGLPWTGDPARPPLGAVVRAQAAHRCGGACAHRRPAHPPDTGLARQPRRVGGAPGRGPHRPGPRGPRRRDPLPRRLPRAAGAAGLTPGRPGRRSTGPGPRGPPGAADPPRTGRTPVA